MWSQVNWILIHEHKNGQEEISCSINIYHTRHRPGQHTFPFPLPPLLVAGANSYIHTHIQERTRRKILIHNTANTRHKPNRSCIPIQSKTNLMPIDATYCIMLHQKYWVSRWLATSSYRSRIQLYALTSRARWKTICWKQRSKKNTIPNPINLRKIEIRDKKNTLDSTNHNWV